jgi:hypothetical protein
MPRRGPKQFGKTKSHFFQSLNLDDVITPEEPGSDKFTGGPAAAAAAPDAGAWVERVEGTQQGSNG